MTETNTGANDLSQILKRATPGECLEMSGKPAGKREKQRESIGTTIMVPWGALISPSAQ